MAVFTARSIYSRDDDRDAGLVLLPRLAFGPFVVFLAGLAILVFTPFAFGDEVAVTAA